MSRDLRCDNKKHGALVDAVTVEIKCDSRFCGAGRGVVVLHRWDLRTGEIVRTIKFKSPTERNN